MDANPPGYFGNPDADLADLSAGLKTLLDDPALRDPAAHAEWITLVSAVLSEALRRRGMLATLVGGGALEFYVPEGYVTDDIDLVVQAVVGLLDRNALDAAFRDLGFSKRGRHWVREDVFVEVPGIYLEDPFEEHEVGPFALRVVRPEVVLVGRLVEYDQTGHTGHGAQAALLIESLRHEWDGPLLDTLLRRERCYNVFSALRHLADSGQPVNDELLRATWDRLHGRMPQEGAEEEE